MLHDKKILAVVPARGGSKGIPLKNLCTVAGVPLVGWAGKTIGELPEIDRAVVSTDHPKIVEVAKSYGLDAPFLRPADLSGDRIGDLDVLTHALLECESLDDMTYDIVVMLQPTSPLRKASDVQKTISTLVESNVDAVWTVSETDSKAHPLKQLTVSDGNLGYYDEKGAEVIARQQLEPLYHRNGIAYAITRECLLEQKTLMGKRTQAVIVEGHFISIDTEWDIMLTELLLQKHAA